MNRRFFLSFLAVSAASHRLGYATGDTPLSGKDLSQFTVIAEGIRRASLKLYEGLPHPVREPDKLEHELSTKKTIRLRGYAFYERPLAVAAKDVESLRRLSAAAESYSPFSLKRCGVYHPDYGLAWKDGEARYELLICFGCKEMKLYGPTSELTVDIRPDTFKTFQAALNKYWAQRPPIAPA